MNVYKGRKIPTFANGFKKEEGMEKRPLYWGWKSFGMREKARWGWRWWWEVCMGKKTDTFVNICVYILHGAYLQKNTYFLLNYYYFVDIKKVSAGFGIWNCSVGLEI